MFIQKIKAMINSKFRFFLTVAIATFVSLSSIAQDKVLHGIVTTFDSIPLIGAEIRAQGSKQTVLTDSLGKFTIPVTKKEKLKVSANGFFNQKVKLEEKTKYAAINLKLKPGEKSREYAIGYGHVSDENKLNALSNLDHKDYDFSQYNSVMEIIKGRFAGVQVINNEIIIRGQSSVSMSNAALLIVDGVQVNETTLNSIPPVQIKSINIIKDGSAAIYGTRSANGVVIIETKRGNE